MKTALRIAVTLSLLLASAHRLPAPIVEESTPTPTPARSTEPKSKPATSQKAEASSDSSAARRFDGTWKGTLVNKTAQADYSESYTLIIRDGKTADSTREAISVLHGPKGWSDLPEAYRHLSPLSFRTANHSDHLIADGSDLMIRFSAPPRLIDWAPKTLPLGEVQKLAGMDKATNLTIGLTLKGDELVLGKVVFHRAK
jgi:hypothetical protein